MPTPVIKAISKKKESLINQEPRAFIEGAVENGLAEKEARGRYLELIVKFAGYGFNKSHIHRLCLLAYQTAYLKAHSPVEFMAALLSSDISGRNFKRKDALVEHMEDCRNEHHGRAAGCELTSDVDFTVADNKISFGLSAIKGCGGGAGAAIAAARRKGGTFTSLFDFCERVDMQSCGRAAIETLIKAGAMDDFGGDRARLSAAMNQGACKFAQLRGNGRPQERPSQPVRYVRR